MHPALSVLVGLAVALLLNRCRVPLGLAFVAGAATITLGSGLGFTATGAAFGEVLGAPKTWAFAGQVTLVFVLSIVMKLAGGLDVLVEAAGALIRNRRARLASLPALVGLLPMPGGAVVSAPLVDQTRCDVELGARDKNLINYWFRHVWEVCWPLYPPLLYVATLLPGGDMSQLVASQAPLTLLLVLGGWWFILRRVPGGDDALSGDRPTRKALVAALLPLVVVIVAMPLCRMPLEGLVAPELVGGTGLLMALGIGLLTALGRRPRLLMEALKEKRVWTLLVLAFGVKIFGGMVEVTGAASQTATLIRDVGLAPLIAIVVLPFFIGFVSGATIVVVTVSFPVIVALVGLDASAATLLPYFVLGYATGFIGYMLSPVHMCLVLSSKFFGETVTAAYGRLAAPLMVFFVGSAGVYAALTAMLS